MLDKQFSGLPVLDEAGRLVGVLTESGAILQERPGPSRRGSCSDHSS